MKLLFVVLSLMIGLSASADTKSVDLVSKQKKQLALTLVKATSKHPSAKREIIESVQTAEVIRVTVSETFQTSESDVMCTKTIQFTKDKEEPTLEIITISEGLCFS